MDERITVSVEDAAKMIGIGKTYTYRLINDRQLLTIRLGRRTLVTTESIHALIKARAA